MNEPQKRIYFFEEEDLESLYFTDILKARDVLKEKVIAAFGFLPEEFDECLEVESVPDWMELSDCLKFSYSHDNPNFEAEMVAFNKWEVEQKVKQQAIRDHQKKFDDAQDHRKQYKIDQRKKRIQERNKRVKDGRANN